MRIFKCPSCGSRVFFENYVCPSCEKALVFDPASMKMDVVSSALGPACANRGQAACNWRVDDGQKESYCIACRLNHVIPNIGSPLNLALWRRIELAKRRLVYDLLRLGLPIVNRREDAKEGLCFDFLSDDAAPRPIMTGHEDGLITINIAEADDSQREARRAAMGEPYRTLLGHFRHEVGHFYWNVLVRDSPMLSAFRATFGDEREDYGEALKRHYASGPKQDWKRFHISAYASSHAWEDWAECFAHFLHIVSTLDTASSLPLMLHQRHRATLSDPYREMDFDALIEAWIPVAESLNELNRSMGVLDAYPFVLTPAVIGKLHIVHLIVTHGAREAGFAAPAAKPAPAAGKTAARPAPAASPDPPQS